MFVAATDEGIRSAGELKGALAEKRERSIMKLPAARLAGVLGRWRNNEMS